MNEARITPGADALSDLLLYTPKRTLRILQSLCRNPHTLERKSCDVQINKVKNTSPTRERASAPGVRASVTIEAAFAVPLFIFAVLSLIFLIEIQSIRGCIHAAGSDAAKQAAESTAVLPVLNTIQLKSNLVNLIGEERIERSILNGGTSAISCWKSYWIPGTEEINVVIEYKIKIPVPLLKSPS